MRDEPIPIGETFNRLTVVGPAPSRGGARWQCRCVCGNELSVRRRFVLSGGTQSCGCLRDEKSRARRLKHDKSGTREYRSWAAAKTRCYNPRQRAWPDYGGRGITMCDDWRNSFEAFLRDMGPCPEGHSIDRIDVNGNYEPGNCRWAPDEIQANNKTNNRILELNGERHTVQEWARIKGVPRERINARLKRGWTVADALTVEGDATRHRYITHGAATLPLKEWARRSGLSKETIAYRLKTGWSVERALTTPVR